MESICNCNRCNCITFFQILVYSSQQITHSHTHIQMYHFNKMVSIGRKLSGKPHVVIPQSTRVSSVNRRLFNTRITVFKTFVDCGNLSLSLEDMPNYIWIENSLSGLSALLENPHCDRIEPHRTALNRIQPTFFLSLNGRLTFNCDFARKTLAVPN